MLEQCNLSDWGFIFFVSLNCIDGKGICYLSSSKEPFLFIRREWFFRPFFFELGVHCRVRGRYILTAD